MQKPDAVGRVPLSTDLVPRGNLDRLGAPCDHELRLF